MGRWVEGVVGVGAGADAGATKSVLGDAGTAGDSERSGYIYRLLEFISCGYV